MTDQKSQPNTLAHAHAPGAEHEHSHLDEMDLRVRALETLLTEV